jgi:beta-lactamase regulating signal transducer with metallopeptidase domain
MMSAALQPFASFASLAGGRMINCVVEGVLIALLAWALLRATACRNSGTRFAVWFSALVAIAALSITSFAVRGANVASAGLVSQIALPLSWLFYAFLIWAAIAAFGLLRVAACLRQVWSLRRRSRVLSENEIDPLLRQTLADFGSFRHVTLYVCDDLRVPAAIGFFRPAVVIPRWAFEELSAGELNAVLLHELGHLRRWDDWTNLAQKILRAVLFFHPGVWWIDSRLTLEREMACDDLVLAETSDARSYAQCLVSVAEKSLLRTGLALALAVVSRMRQTAARLTRILDPNRVSETRVSKPALAGVSAIAVAALIALPHTPTLVAFQNPAMTASAGDRGENVVPRSVGFGAQVSKSRLNVSATQVHVVPAVLGPAFAGSLQGSVGLREIKTKSPAEGGRNHGSLAVYSGTPRPKVVKVAFRTSLSPRHNRVDDQVENPTFLLLVQTEEFDANGTPMWSLRVLRLTFTPNQKQIQSLNGTNASSI